MVENPIEENLMSSGQPFEVIKKDVAGRQIRMFKHAPENLVQLLKKARGFGTSEFIVFEDRRLDYAEFFDQADHMAAWLQEQANIKPGDHIAICMKNCPEWMITFVAIQLVGGVSVLINSRGEPDTMAAAIEDAQCVFVIADADRLNALRRGKCDLPAISTSGEVPRTTDMDIALKYDGNIIPHQAQSDDLAVMMFTSGTTGRAKAAALSHLALVTGIMNTQMSTAAVFIAMAQRYNISVDQLKAQMPQSCSLLVFPLFHTSGCNAIFLTTLANGGKLAVLPKWNAEAAMATIEKEKVTSFGGVPTMHWDVMRSPSFGKYDLSSLMAVSNAGQATPLVLLEELQQKFPGIIIGAGYGMTESNGAIAQINGDAYLKRPQCSGRILPMMDVKIVDEDGIDLPVGEAGEIWTKGATLMQGYYGRPEATKKSMSGEWYKTGDVGYIDRDGFIYIVDRKTDMVISGGENIYCPEIEQALSRHKSILEITTFAVPDDRLGERLVAVARVDENGTTASNLHNFAHEVLASYKVPSEIVLTTEPFPYNAMGKVEKNKVKDWYLAVSHKS